MSVSLGALWNETNVSRRDGLASVSMTNRVRVRDAAALRRFVVIPLLWGLVLLLTGCGPASLRARLPQHLPFTNIGRTGVVRTAPVTLLLAPSDMPPTLRALPQVPVHQDTLVTAAIPAGATVGSAQWHHLYGAAMTYVLPRRTPVPMNADHPLVDLALGEYATVHDAVGMFADLTAKLPAGERRISTQGLGPHAMGYQTMLLPDQVRLIVFQQRNVVARVLVVAPTGSPALRLAPAIAKNEYAKIAAAR